MRTNLSSPSHGSRRVRVPRPAKFPAGTSGCVQALLIYPDSFPKETRHHLAASP